MNEMSPLPLTREAFEASMADYRAAGVARADAIGNRGPLVLDANGKLHPDILAAYWKHGYYIFEDVIDAGEIDALRHDAQVMIERAPVHRDAKVDAAGRPAMGRDHQRGP